MNMFLTSHAVVLATALASAGVSMAETSSTDTQTRSAFRSRFFSRADFDGSLRRKFGPSGAQVRRCLSPGEQDKTTLSSHD